MKILTIIEYIYCLVVPQILRPRFKVENLEYKLEEHQKWLESEHKNEHEKLVLRHKKLSFVDFSNYNLEKAIFFNCDLRGAKFMREEINEDIQNYEYKKNLRGCNFSFSRLEGAILAPHNFVDRKQRNALEGIDVSDAILIDVTGLYGDSKAYMGRGLTFSPLKPPIIQLWGFGSSIGDFPSWETVKILKTIPLFNVSNIVIGGIIVYSGFARWYNNQISKLSDLEPSQVDKSIWELLSVFQKAPAPSHLGNLLLIFIGLMIANLLFKFYCPESVQQYTRFSIFGRSHDRREMINYLSATYSKRFIRIICFIITFTSGGYLIVYLGKRIKDALDFFFPTYL